MRITGTSGSGSGFVVDSAGYILTNDHVVHGAGRLTVVFDDGARVTARVVASDAARDIALLRVETARRLTALPIATGTREGDQVVALGYPLDLRGRMTVTQGIVSAFRTVEGVAHVQTDAAINPGNSGGPLLNPQGRSRRHEQPWTPRRRWDRICHQVRRTGQPLAANDVERIVRHRHADADSNPEGCLSHTSPSAR